MFILEIYILKSSRLSHALLSTFICLLLGGVSACEDSNSSIEMSRLDGGEGAEMEVVSDPEAGTSGVVEDLGVSEEVDEGLGWSMSDLGDDMAIDLSMDARLTQSDLGVSEVSLEVMIEQPIAGSTIQRARELGLRAQIIAEGVALSFVSIQLTSSIDGLIPVLFDVESGRVTATLADLSQAQHTLTLTARVAPNVEVSQRVELSLPCDFETDFSQPLSPMNWRVLGSARHDPRGWLEMTDHQQQVAGAIFLVGQGVNPGDLEARFRISAGACDDIGTCVNSQVSDGLAMTFWNIRVDEIDMLWELIRAGTGSAISYQRITEHGLERRPEGITIEFDLYPNSCPPNGFWDPVQTPHVEINFDGRFHMTPDDLTSEERCMESDPGARYPGYWTSTPQLTDNQWHDVHVSVQGTHVNVTLDEVLVVDTDIPNFMFKGGVLAFSGGSGSVPAYLRFDDLHFESSCPDRP
jgi:hypothetical protein